MRRSGSCDDQALISTGFATITDAPPDLEVVSECEDGRAAVDLAGAIETRTSW